MITVPSRRGFITGMAAGLFAPAVVHATNIMPVKLFVPPFKIVKVEYVMSFVHNDETFEWSKFGKGRQYRDDRNVNTIQLDPIEVGQMLEERDTLDLLGGHTLTMKVRKVA